MHASCMYLYFIFINIRDLGKDCFISVFFSTSGCGVENKFESLHNTASYLKTLKMVPSDALSGKRL